MLTAQWKLASNGTNRKKERKMNYDRKKQTMERIEEASVNYRFNKRSYLLHRYGAMIVSHSQYQVRTTMYSSAVIKTICEKIIRSTKTLRIVT